MIVDINHAFPTADSIWAYCQLLANECALNTG